MGLDVTGGNSTGIKSDNLVIKAGKAALPFGENDRLEAGVTVTGNVNNKIAELALDPFLISAVSGIAGLFLCGAFFS